jgi:hypothetical protein
MSPLSGSHLRGRVSGSNGRFERPRLSGRTMQTNITEKLQDIVTDVKALGHANLTRLTVLKKWFEAPSRIMSFGAFIAIQASRQTRKTTKEVEQLLCEAREILVDVDLFTPKTLNKMEARPGRGRFYRPHSGPAKAVVASGECESAARPPLRTRSADQPTN